MMESSRGAAEEAAQKFAFCPEINHSVSLLSDEWEKNKKGTASLHS